MFYSMQQAGKPKRWLDIDDYISKGYKKTPNKWFRGEVFTAPVPFMDIKLLHNHPANTSMSDFLAPYMSQCGCHFFRDDLIAALEAVGVDNLHKYPVSITDPDDGKVYNNYKAVNIIGVVSAADMKKSKFELGDSTPLMDVPFDDLILKENDMKGLLMFRLAESLISILVHERVKNHLLEKGFIHGGFNDHIEFYKLEEIAFL
ncbi:hypothetical protein DMB65_12285 [Flavobacterium cheongpyeongense]|uniref:Uncharacterized protein n=2 Tax=Flavobacterium cheongpyeongense TaxID=2212651 RepID=A0A2V4BN01_9FLAO|nr:hypothetical protein DMB65_12285 [Flavobacterium cheongpyeongense]